MHAMVIALCTNSSQSHRNKPATPKRRLNAYNWNAQKEKNMLQVMGSFGATGVSFRKEESVPREDGSGGYRLSCGN
jgi:hypothetical protein|tara:strand:- start:7303 stop:7530 length:228 start_codon:yes stop_codon:yes gene_type:complete